MNLTLAEIKAISKEYMDEFHPDNDWWVIGGALRDIILGKDIKDIDIFVKGTSEDALPVGAADLGDRNAYLLRAKVVHRLYKGKRIEINVIVMRGDFWTLEKMADRCDFGICQVGWCPKEDRVYQSEAFVYDVTHDTITLDRDTPLERIERMKTKYPTFVYRNPKNIVAGTPRAWTYDHVSGMVMLAT